MNLLLRSVAERLLGNGKRDVGIAGNAQVKDLRFVGIGRSKGSNDDRSGNRLRGSQELVGEIFVGLRVSVVFVQLLDNTHKIHAALATVLDIEYKRLFHSCNGVGKGEESLMWPRSVLSVLGSKLKLQ